MSESIKLEPNWENTAKWFAKGLAEHAFEKGAMLPVISFIEQIGYLATNHPEVLTRVHTELKALEVREAAYRTRREAANA